MANVIGLQGRQVFLSAGEPAAYAQVYFRRSGTDTQVSVYADVDLLSERSQPVECDADGVMPPCYIGSPDPLRLLVTDQNGDPLPGYPMDNIVPFAAEAAAAGTVGFSPTDAVPETNVQAAIERVAALFGDQSALISRPMTPYGTGGTGNAYTLTPSPEITAYQAGQSFLVRPDRANTGPATLNINGLGDRSIRKVIADGTPAPLAAGEIAAGREFSVYDDGSYLLMTLGRDAPVYANTANGSHFRFASGVQICWFSAAGPFVFATSGALNYTWTFPAPFANANAVVLKSGGSTAAWYTGLARSDVGQFTYTATNTAAACTLWKAPAAADFELGDSITNTRLFAIGMWA